MSKIVILILIILISGLGFCFLFKEKETLPEFLEKPIINQTKEIKEIPEKETALPYKEGISIITIYDNYQVDSQLKTGWGFSCLIKIDDKNILFDTGADSPTLLFNMEKMEINPKEIDLIVLSHIHGDHIDGLEGILEKNGNVTVYIPASFPNSLREKIKSYGGKYINVSKSMEILEDVYSTGELGTWIKEQSLIINTNKGLVIITGCAHPGVVNIVEKAKEMFLYPVRNNTSNGAGKNIYLVLGGFHLSGANNSELKEIVEDFRKIGVQKVAPCHCSGDRCRELFKQEYQDDFIENGVGKIIEI